MVRHARPEKAERQGACIQALQGLGDRSLHTYGVESIRKARQAMREEVPFLQDLLFVHAMRQAVDPVVEKHNTVQYRYVRGGYKIPMTVRESDMQRFIHAVESTENPRYFTPEEISPGMVGRKVRIVGGPLDGYEGHLQKIQGAHAKRLFVELPNLLAAAVEVRPEYIQLI